VINEHVLSKRFDRFLTTFNKQIINTFQHLISCSGGLNISININSTKTLIQRQRRYTYWSSLYLDQHGEEDVNLRLFKTLKMKYFIKYFRRGRMLYLDKNRLKLLYSAWISSNLDQLTHRWSTEPFDF
jgi:hypothetical protein